MYKYFIEYLGTLVVVTANLLTHSDPIVIGLVYFAALTTANNMTSGFFNPFVPIGNYVIGRIEFDEVLYNLAAQLAGGLSAIILFDPIKVYID